WFLAGLLAEWPRYRKCDGCERDQLEEKQEVPLKPLEWLVCGEIADEVVPQESGRHLLVVASDLEQVEDDNDGQGDAQRERNRGDEVQRHSYPSGRISEPRRGGGGRRTPGSRAA